MLCRSCAFETERLLVKEWHSISPDDWQKHDLIQVVSDILTEPVTRSLPTQWQGNYTPDRADQWIRERDSEGTTLIIVERSTRQPVGLMILLETYAHDDADGVEIRLGYLLSTPTWGKGYASEVVSSFVAWSRGQPAISSLAGGVAQDNIASKRVLEKNGFRQVLTDVGATEDEQVFRLPL